MSDLRNRGQYDQATQEEFEYLEGRLAALEALLEDGELTGGGSMTGIADIYYGDVAINNGNSSGTSTLPRNFPKASSTLHPLGSQHSAADPNANNVNANIVLEDDGLTITGTRGGTTGDLTIGYMVVRHVLVEE